MPRPVADTLPERYDLALRYAKDKHLPVEMRPKPTAFWPEENVQLLERYHRWLLEGGASEYQTNLVYFPAAGHVLGLALKSWKELDLEADFEPAMNYVRKKSVSKDWIKACGYGLERFRRFLRLEKGLGERIGITPFDHTRVTRGFPEWLVEKLLKYQRIRQANWRSARIEQNIRQFWCGFGRMWRYLIEDCGVWEISDLKRQHILAYVDGRLVQGYAPSGVNADLRSLLAFLGFLQEEGLSIPRSLLNIPSIKLPKRQPKYLTDEQVGKLRDQIEKDVREARRSNHVRDVQLMRAAFYLLWQGGLRLGEVQELRLEDLDMPQKRLIVRDGKGMVDRTVYLTETVIAALQEYLAVRGQGFSDHLFLYRNAPIKKDLIRGRLKALGERVGIRVYPHRLRHTAATQLLNAGCRVTSIQKFLGHKELRTTMIYAHAHDQTVAEDYFAAMERVEKRLEIAPDGQKDHKNGLNVKVQGQNYLKMLAERLEMPQISFEERRELVSQLQDILDV